MQRQAGGRDASGFAGEHSTRRAAMVSRDRRRWAFRSAVYHQVGIGQEWDVMAGTTSERLSGINQGR